jgi:hypothetical protein
MRVDPRRDLRPPRAVIVRLATRALKALRILDFAPPALRAADGLDRANREPVLATIDGRQTQTCLTTFSDGATV